MSSAKRFIVCFSVILVLFINMSLPVFAADWTPGDSVAYVISRDIGIAEARELLIYSLNYNSQATPFNLSKAHYMYFHKNGDPASDGLVYYELILIDCPSDTKVIFDTYLKFPDYYNCVDYSFTVGRNSNNDLYVNVANPKPGSFNRNYVYYPSITSTGRGLIATDLDIVDADGNSVHEKDTNDYDASITLTDNNTSFTYSFTNYTDDKSYWLKYGVQSMNYNQSTKVPAGGGYTDSISVQDFKDWADDHGTDYRECVAYLSVFNEAGDTLLDNITLSLADAVADDGMYNEKKEYEDFPDIADYFNDPPEFPELDPFPTFPGWDPDHPWESLKDILLWLGQCILTPFKNLFKILSWIIETIIYYITEFVRYLKDCFVVLIHNIGIALYNLIFDIRALVTYLFVPKKKNISDIISEKFPIYEQIQHIFLSLSTGASSVSFTFLDQNVTLNLASGFSAYFSSALYSFSTIAFDVMTVLQIFKLVLSVLDITVESSVQSVSNN